MDEAFTRKSLLNELGEVLRLSLPIIVTTLSHTLMQFVDVLMLGKYGRLELAASSPAGMTFFVVASFLIGINSCNNTFVSQSMGRGHPSECARYTVHAIYLALIAQVLMIPLIIGGHVVFEFFAHEPEIRVLETTYFRVRGFQLGGVGMVVALATFYQGTGRPVIPMIAALVANALNVLGNYLLIFGKFGFPEWGIFGAGLATTVMTYVQVLILLGVFLSRRTHAKFTTRRWRPFELQRIRRLLAIGVPAGVSFALDVASWAIFINLVIGRLGTNTLAGSNVAGQIMALSFMPTVGLGIAVTALVGRYIGKGDIPGAKRRAYVAMACACSYMTLMGVLFVLFRGPLIRMFSSEPEIVRVGGIILCYAALFQFSDAIGILSHAALKGAGDMKFAAIVHVLTAWFFFLPLVLFLGRGQAWGVHGAWISATAYIWIIDVIFFRRFVGERWRKIDIFK